MNTINLRLYNIFRQDFSLTEDKAHELVNVMDEFVKTKSDNSIATKEFVKDEIVLVKDEIHRLELKVEQLKSEVTKAIFWSSLIQFLAIIGSVIGILTFMLRK